MSDVELKIDPELLKFKDKLARADREAPSYIYKGLDKIGNKTRKELKAASPVGKSKKSSKKRLKMRWTAERATKEFGDYVKKVRSKAPHYHLVERGHRIVARGPGKHSRRKYVLKRNRKGGGYISGQYFAKKTFDSLEPEIYQSYEKMLDDIMKTLDR